MNINFQPEKYAMTIRKASYDDAKHQYLVDHDLIVYNFDQIKQFVCNRLRDGSLTRSCDAYFIDKNGGEYLIEFKNQREEDVPRRQVRQKAYDSFYILLLTFGIRKSVEELSKNVSYIVVYNNGARNGPPEKKHKSSKSFEKMARKFGQLAQVENPRVVKFGLSYLQKQLYREIITLDVTEFEEKFINDRFLF